MILFLIPLLVRSGTFKDFYFDLEPRKNTMNLMLPAAAGVLILLFRLILGFGIRLGEAGSTY